MNARSVIGVAVAATVGSAAALSWSLWVWIVSGSAPAEATGQGTVITSASELVDHAGQTAATTWTANGSSSCSVSPPARTSDRAC